MFNCGFKYFDINVNNTLTIVFVINISLYYDLTHSSNAIATIFFSFFLQQFSLKFKYLVTQRTNKSKTLLLDISIAM